MRVRDSRRPQCLLTRQLQILAERFDVAAAKIPFSSGRFPIGSRCCHPELTLGNTPLRCSVDLNLRSALTRLLDIPSRSALILAQIWWLPTTRTEWLLPRFWFRGVRDFLRGGLFPGSALVRREQNFQFRLEIPGDTLTLLLLELLLQLIVTFG